MKLCRVFFTLLAAAVSTAVAVSVSSHLDVESPHVHTGWSKSIMSPIFLPYAPTFLKT